MLTRTLLHELQQAVGTTDWKINFEEFKLRTGFQGSYAESKWKEFHNLSASLGKFDTETLAKILEL